MSPLVFCMIILGLKVLANNWFNFVVVILDWIIILFELLTNTYPVVEKLLTIKLLLIVVFVVLN